jgi:hypothetical protein
MSKQLTVDMIMKRARGNFDLSSIRKLNFWGQSLGDISALSYCVSLESATFSQNYIKSLKCFSGMNNLRELSLAKNAISDLREIQYLSSCPNLMKLWLRDNPIASLWDYRIQIIRILPNLKYLDDEEITQEERQIANTGSFFVNNYGQNNEPKKENIRPPSYDPYRRPDERYNNNFRQYGRAYNRNRDYELEDNNNNNYIGILPGMVDNNKKYIKNVNEYDKFQNKRFNTPGKAYERVGSSRRRDYNNNYPEYNGNMRRVNSNNINVEMNLGYNNNFGRQIPGSAQGHTRNYGNNNPMEVSVTNTQQSQQKVVDCVSVLLKGLNNDELQYIVDHIDKKISKI